MTVYTYSIARQKLASLLDKCQKEGAVRIKRRDGSTFILHPEKTKTSPLNIKGIDLGLSTNELVRIVRKMRRRPS